MLYPVISNMMNSGKVQVVITDYSAAIADNSNNKNQELIDEARKYNSDLSSVNIVDAFSNPREDESDEYRNILNINENGMMGYLSIPKIDIKVPIYHGTSNEVLQKGVGHFEGSSFPVGGESTHAVLSAHSGLPSARLFTDLNQLRVEDMFYIYILDQVFAYKVDQVLVVEPSDVEALELQEGEDYVTLVTCTPYAVNTHRLLVRGTRVEYSPEVLESTPVQKTLAKDEIILYVSLGLVFVVLLLVIFFVIKSKKKVDNNTSNNQITTDQVLVDNTNNYSNVSNTIVNTSPSVTTDVSKNTIEVSVNSRVNNGGNVVVNTIPNATSSNMPVNTTVQSSNVDNNTVPSIVSNVNTSAVVNNNVDTNTTPVIVSNTNVVNPNVIQNSEVVTNPNITNNNGPLVNQTTNVINNNFEQNTFDEAKTNTNNNMDVL